MFYLGLDYAGLDIIAKKMSWLRLISNFYKLFLAFFISGLLNKFYANLSLIRMCFFVLESLIDVRILFQRYADGSFSELQTPVPPGLVGSSK